MPGTSFKSHPSISWCASPISRAKEIYNLWACSSPRPASTISSKIPLLHYAARIYIHGLWSDQRFSWRMYPLISIVVPHTRAEVQPRCGYICLYQTKSTPHRLSDNAWYFSHFHFCICYAVGCKSKWPPRAAGQNEFFFSLIWLNVVHMAACPQLLS